MSLYFFHVRDGSTSLDDEGVDLPNVASARNEAVRACGEILRELPASGLNGEMLRLWVTDEPDGRGNTLFSLNVSSVTR